VGRTSSNRIRWHRCSRAHPVHLADPAADLIVELTVLGPEGGSGAGQSAGCDVVRGHSGRPGPGRCRHRVHPAARQSALRQHLRDEIVARSYERTGRETPSRCPAGGGGSWLGRRAPLGSTLTTLWPTAHQGRCEVDGPGVPRMPDDYPETFRTYASRRALIVLVNVTAAGCRDLGTLVAAALTSVDRGCSLRPTMTSGADQRTRRFGGGHRWPTPHGTATR
jgi:hypothetical protein